MGAQQGGCGCVPQDAETKDTVKLHIYDLLGNRVIEEANKAFRTIGTGAFHAGVEVFGKEWSFGFCEEGTGVFPCTPKGCGMHKFRETLSLGETDLTEEEFQTTIEKLQAQWQGMDYDLLQRNCCHFAKALAEAVHAQAPPPWVTSLAGAGATVNKGINDSMVKGGDLMDKAHAAAIIAAAKAGKIDEQYQIKGKVKARAEELLIKAGEIDQKWELHKHAENIKNEVHGHATRIGGHVANFFAQGSTPPKEASSTTAAQ